MARGLGKRRFRLRGLLRRRLVRGMMEKQYNRFSAGSWTNSPSTCAAVSQYQIADSNTLSWMSPNTTLPRMVMSLADALWLPSGITLTLQSNVLGLNINGVLSRGGIINYMPAHLTNTIQISRKITTSSTSTVFVPLPTSSPGKGTLLIPTKANVTCTGDCEGCVGERLCWGLQRLLSGRCTRALPICAPFSLALHLLLQMRQRSSRRRVRALPRGYYSVNLFYTQFTPVSQ